MPSYRISDAAKLLGISDDTARRWAEAGRFATTADEAGRLAVDGAELARLATTFADTSERGLVSSWINNEIAASSSTSLRCLRR